MYNITWSCNKATSYYETITGGARAVCLYYFKCY